MDHSSPAFPIAAAFHASRRPRVLLAEDHPINRQTIQIMLGDRVDLHLAVNGLEALDAARTWDFDVILMDADMPLMNGLEATRAIRAAEALEARSPTHVVLLTCATAPDPGLIAAACGADQHLARPLTEDALIGAIARQAQGLVDDESLAQLRAAA
ncbi:MAG TPA: response regulator [Caulobacteraceae bacterium]|jgi:CheY-like chemotaxis protein